MCNSLASHRHLGIHTELLAPGLVELIQCGVADNLRKTLNRGKAAFNRYHRIVTEHLALPDNEIVVCGMSIGCADPSQPENALVSKREEVDDLVRFLM